MNCSYHLYFTINNTLFQSFAFPLVPPNARQIPLSRRNPAVKYSSHRIEKDDNPTRRAARGFSRKEKFWSVFRARPNIPVCFPSIL